VELGAQDKRRPQIRAESAKAVLYTPAYIQDNVFMAWICHYF